MIYRTLARLRPFVQAAALLVFVAVLLTTQRDAAPLLPASLFFRLDPLAALAAMLAGRAWLAPLALSLVVVAVTLLSGRTWCGWLCPLGTVLDLFPGARARGNRRPGLAPATRWRRVKSVVLVALLGGALLGSLAFLPLDPITLLARTLAAGLLPLLNLALIALEGLLYGVPALEGAVDWLAGARTAVLPAEQPAYWPAGLVLAVLVAVIALNRLAPRFWCRYLCPLGALLGWLSRPALLRRQVMAETCSGCRRCARQCPTGTIDPARGYQSDPAECTVCLECVVDCPQQAARFGLHAVPAFRQPYDPSRRQALAALAAGIGGAALVRVVPRDWQVADTLVRPPGAQGGEFWQRCIRCGECMKVCPTSGLQPAWWQSGPDGVGTPVLVPRTGYCDYSCHSCGQVCPTGAIAPLTLEEKRETVIGVAGIDRTRCLPWAAATPCIVCEEMCPLPDKAVDLEEAQAVDAAGQEVTVQRPHVVAERCIGCGICEFKCPLDGAAAIRVGRPSVS